MSENFEESPVSDGKMDISEPTTVSQESVMTSPLNDDDDDEEKGPPAMLTSNTTTESVTQALAATTTNHSTIDNFPQTATSKLDNRHRLLDNDPSAKLTMTNSNSSGTVVGRSSELTIANSHPLMSPPGTDSDSENGHRRVFNFPDVVPESEPLRLANPPAIRHSHKGSPSAARATSTTPQHLSNRSNLDVTADCATAARSSRRKISVHRESSPDLFSSESEQDISQYQANVESNYQSVALISNNQTLRLRCVARRMLYISQCCTTGENAVLYSEMLYVWSAYVIVNTNQSR